MIEDEIKTRDFADLTGLEISEVRQFANDGVAVKASRRGYLVFDRSLQGILNFFSGSEAIERKRYLKQQKTDLENGLKEYQIEHDRGDLIPFADVQYAKMRYAASVTQRHTALPPVMRREGIDRKIVEYFDKQLTQIRNKCIKAKV